METGKKKDKKNITKKESILIIIISIAVMFAICVFNQFDVLFRNQIEFGIQPQEIVLGFVIFMLSVLALSMLVLFLTARYSKTAFKIVLAVMLGFMLASYIQVLFLNGRYNGAFKDYAGEYKPISGAIKLFNLCIWIIVCLLPLALIYIEKKTKKDFFNKFVLLSSVVIFVMQAVGFGTAAPNADFRKYDKSFYFSIDKQLELSKPEKENIVVFILDRTPVGYVDEVFNAYPDAKDNFEGFTYYRNNISEYNQTFPGVITMLTGEYFEKTELRSDFSKRAWQKAELFDELHERGYTVNALPDEMSTHHSLDEISDKFDNIKYVGDERRVSQGRAVKVMTKISFQRTLPYVLKSAAGFDYPDDLNSIVNTDVSDYFPNNAGKNSDRRFAQKLNEAGLSASGETNTFSFVHLNCGHANDWREAVNNTFNMLGDYFEQMKKLGIYENSTIILASDHGADGTDSALFIKEKGQGADAMKIDNTSKLSSGYFLSTIFELIGAEDKKPALSYFDVIHRGFTATRCRYDTSWKVGKHCVFNSKTIIDD